MPRTPKPPGTQHRVDPAERLLGTGLGLALVAGDPADRDLGVVVEAAGAHRLGDREVGVGQVDVLADERDLDGVLGLCTRRSSSSQSCQSTSRKAARAGG